MLKEVNWAEDRDYKTGSEDEPLQFYLDTLCNSKSFDLLLGYFSSAAINLLSLGFASFLYTGGKMRAVINNVLSDEDKTAIENGQNRAKLFGVYNLTDIKQLHQSLNEYGKNFFECFAWLIANDKIEIKIVKPKEGRGIAHYKSGVFSDGENAVSYKSSCNFTYYGFIENLEELECRMTWDDDRSKRSVKKQMEYFEKIFSEKSPNVEYLSISEVKSAIKSEFGNKDIDELLVKEKELLKNRHKDFSNFKTQQVINSAAKRIDEFERIENLPKFPFKEGPRKYQQKAYLKWIENNTKGLFAMATGTGKTLTALNCLLNEYKKDDTYKPILN